MGDFPTRKVVKALSEGRAESKVSEDDTMSETVCVEATTRSIAGLEKVRMVRGREETKLEKGLRQLRQPQRAIQTLERISRMAEEGGSVRDAYVAMTSALGCVQRNRVKEFADQLRRDPDLALQMARKVAGFGE